MYGNFEDMMKRLSPKLRAIAHRMNGHFTFFGDEDLYQEAISHLWEVFCKGTLNDKTDSYILQGCYFHLKNYLRTHLDKAHLVSLNTPTEDQAATLEETLAAESGNKYNDINADIIKDDILFSRLNKRESEVLRLSMDGFTVRQIGERLGVSHVMVIKIKAGIRKKYAFLRKVGRDDKHWS
ncbi:MAG: sigma-70 family RNA polymerase sigma factor [Candidatus Omnitrophica bacterium]|nr:sigma-70 family RNA polymerase sigma factor [Candidatus Omnitrophota bacterium]MCM8790255.1 sigma-70 family RNA polymerase sigma factor [Candidatus Omnitrophota bacterium]